MVSTLFVLNPELTEERDKSGFDALPMALVEAGKPDPRPEIIVGRFADYPSAYIDLLKGIDWLLTQRIDVLALSVGPMTSAFDAADPLQVATRFLHHHAIPVVVSAGNRGPALGTLRALAKAPWVIAVGATDENKRPLDTSSRGSPDGPSPTVVCDGGRKTDLIEIPPQPGWTDYGPGTSFAAPKVAAVTVWVLKCLQLICNDLFDVVQKETGPVGRALDLPIVGTADTGADPSVLPPLPEHIQDLLKHGTGVRISRPKKELQWLESLLASLMKIGAEGLIQVTADIVKRAIEQMATPLPDYLRYEVGAGYLSFDEAIAYFSSFTVSRFVRLFYPELADANRDNLVQADEQFGPLWGPQKIEAIGTTFGAGIRTVHAKVL